MTENMEKEIVRLVKDIAKDEEELVSAERYHLHDKVKSYTEAINRKLEVLRLLTKDKA